MSSRLTHTPGPWHVEYTGTNTFGEDDFDLESATVRSEHGLVVAEVECHHAHVADIEANARLITAAPELLSALFSALPLLRREAERDHGDQQLTAAAETRYQRARDLIAKVRS